MTPLVSIIVPVYKAEKYLSKCIESILAQSYSNFELLLINDGSPDNSGKICEEYALKDSRVRTFHKENGGVSSARNLGLREAKGEWVSWVDADDWIESNMLSTYVNQIDTDVDIFICDFFTVNSDSVGTYSYKFENINKIQIIKSYINTSWIALWATFVRRNIYTKNNIVFSNNVYLWEDFEVIIKLIHYGERVVYVNKPLYYYNRINYNSVVHNVSYDQISEQACITTLNLINFFQENGFIDTYEEDLSWKILKNKEYLIPHPNKWIKYCKIYPESHKYILSCPFYGKKLKILMYCITHNLGFLAKIVVFIFKLLKIKIL